VNRSWPETDFYPAKYGPTKFDALVVDVHTDVPDIFFCGNDPGGVLHQAVGRANLLYIAVDSGTRRTIYAGPVLSYYEFEREFPVRMDDNEWKTMLLQNQAPAPPPWTRNFLVPAQ